MAKMGCEFKTGDVVRAKHGGPLMTVINIVDATKQYKVECAYTDTTHHFVSVELPENCIQKRKKTLAAVGLKGCGNK